MLLNSCSSKTALSLTSGDPLFPLPSPMPESTILILFPIAVFLLCSSKALYMLCRLKQHSDSLRTDSPKHCLLVLHCLGCWKVFYLTYFLFSACLLPNLPPCLLPPLCSITSWHLVKVKKRTWVLLLCPVFVLSPSNEVTTVSPIFSLNSHFLTNRIVLLLPSGTSSVSILLELRCQKVVSCLGRGLINLKRCLNYFVSLITPAGFGCSCWIPFCCLLSSFWKHTTKVAILQPPFIRIIPAGA